VHLLVFQAYINAMHGSRSKMEVKPFELGVNCISVEFMVTELYLLRTQCMYVFSVISVINSDYFPTQHQPIESTLFSVR
jgi:hypothetical protein